MEMNDNHKKAKLDVLKALRQVAMDLIKEKSEEGEGEEGEMPGMPEHMQKVSVMAKDPKDLAKGLDLAKQVAGKLPEVSDDESAESSEEQSLESLAGAEGGSEEDEEAMLLQKLEALKKKMLA
jgi:hypothetical protein